MSGKVNQSGVWGTVAKTRRFLAFLLTAAMVSELVPAQGLQAVLPQPAAQAVEAAARSEARADEENGTDEQQDENGTDERQETPADGQGGTVTDGQAEGTGDAQPSGDGTATSEQELPDSEEPEKTDTLTVSTAAELAAALKSDGTLTVDDKPVDVASYPTVSLGDDITVTARLDVTRDVTLDLNGHTISGALGGYVILAAKRLTVTDGSGGFAGVTFDEANRRVALKTGNAAGAAVATGDDKVVSNVGGGKIVNTGSGRAIYVGNDATAQLTLKAGTVQSVRNVAIDAVNSGIVNIEGGYVRAQEFGVLATRNGVVNVSGGLVHGLDNVAVGNNGTAGIGGTAITVSGGTLVGDIETDGYISCGIYSANTNGVDVTGGRIYSLKGAGIVARAGEVRVSGGSITTYGTRTGRVGDSKVELASSGVIVDEKAGYPGAQGEDGKLRAVVTGGSIAVKGAGSASADAADADATTTQQAAATDALDALASALGPKQALAAEGDGATPKVAEVMRGDASGEGAKKNNDLLEFGVGEGGTGPTLDGALPEDFASYLSDELQDNYAGLTANGGTLITASKAGYEVKLKASADSEKGYASGELEFAYSGGARIPAVVVTKTTSEGTATLGERSYSVTITDAEGNAATEPTSVGTYTVTVTGTGDETFTVALTYRIASELITAVANRAYFADDSGAEAMHPTLTYTGAAQVPTLRRLVYYGTVNGVMQETDVSGQFKDKETDTFTATVTATNNVEAGTAHAFVRAENYGESISQDFTIKPASLADATVALSAGGTELVADEESADTYTVAAGNLTALPVVAVKLGENAIASGEYKTSWAYRAGAASAENPVTNDNPATALAAGNTLTGTVATNGGNFDDHTHVVTVKIVPAVASIDGVTYGTLAEAVAAVTTSDATTITLLQDVTSPLEVTDASDNTKRSIVLDLNGKTLSPAAGELQAAVALSGSSTLTIKDSSSGASGKVTGAITVAADAMLNILAGAYTALPTGDGTIAISGGTFQNVSTAQLSALIDLCAAYHVPEAQGSDGTYIVTKRENVVAATIVNGALTYYKVKADSPASSQHEYADSTQALMAAVDAAYIGGIVEILQDITAINWKQRWNADGITIDGNGYTLDFASIESGLNGDVILYRAKNTTIKHLAVKLPSGKNGFLLTSGTVEDVTIEGGNYGVFVGRNSSAGDPGVTVKECTFKDQSGWAVYSNEEPAYNLVVDQCDFQNVGVVVALVRNTRFTNNTVKSGSEKHDDGVQVMSQQVTMTGNVIDGYGIGLWSLHNVEDGTGTQNMSGNDLSKITKVTENDASHKNSYVFDGNYWPEGNEPTTVALPSTVSVSSYCTVADYNTDGSLKSVSKPVNTVAAVSTDNGATYTYYAGVAAAITAAGANGQVKLLQNAELPANATLGDSLSIDLNGHTLTVPAASTLSVAGQTITDSTTEGAKGTVKVAGTLNVSSGSVLVDVSTGDDSEAQGTVTITGGTFSFDPTTYVPATPKKRIVSTTADGVTTYTVRDWVSVTYDVGEGKTYTTLEDAINKLKTDVANTESFKNGIDEVTYTIHGDVTLTCSNTKYLPDLTGVSDNTSKNATNDRHPIVVNVQAAAGLSAKPTFELKGAYYGKLAAAGAELNMKGLTLIDARNNSGEGKDPDPWEFCYIMLDCGSSNFTDCLFREGVMTSSDMTLDGCSFEFPDEAIYSDHYAVWMRNQCDVTVRNSTFTGIGYGAFKSDAKYEGSQPKGWGVHNLVIDGCTFTECGTTGEHRLVHLDAGISVAITNSSITDCYVAAGDAPLVKIKNDTALTSKQTSNGATATKGATTTITTPSGSETGANTIENHVAKIVSGESTTRYDTLPLALDAVPTDGTETTVTLLQNGKATTHAIDDVATKAGQNVKLDLNGTKLSINENKKLTVVADSTLTLAEADGGTGGVAGAGTIEVAKGATLNVTGGSYGNPSALITGEGTVAISGGTFTVAVPREMCAKGYFPVTKTVASATVYTVESKDYVAYIASTDGEIAYYSTLNAATDAVADDQTITLLDNATVSTKLNISGKKNVTVDLQQYTLSFATGDNHIIGDSSVTFKNGSINVDKVQNSGDCIFGVGHYSGSNTLTLDGITLTGNGYKSGFAVFYVYDAGQNVLNIKNSTLTLKCADSDIKGGVIKCSNSYDPMINIENSTINATTKGSSAFLRCTFNINKSTISLSGDGSNGFNRDALKIQDSTITIKSTEGSTSTEGRGITVEDADIQILGSSKVTVSNMPEGNLVFKDESAVEIAETATVDVPDPTAFKARIGNKHYGSLNYAVAAASEGDTIVLLADVSEAVTVNKKVTINGQYQDGDEQKAHKITGITTVSAEGVAFQNVAFEHESRTWGEGGGNGFIFKFSGSYNDLTLKDCSFTCTSKDDDGNPKQGDMAIGYHASNTKLTVEGCTFTNFDRGVYFCGDNTCPAGITFKNNTFVNVDKPIDGYWGTAYSGNTDNIAITGNTFDVATGKVAYVGLWDYVQYLDWEKQQKDPAAKASGSAIHASVKDNTVKGGGTVVLAKVHADWLSKTSITTNGNAAAENEQGAFSEQYYNLVALENVKVGDTITATRAGGNDGVYYYEDYRTLEVKSDNIKTAGSGAKYQRFYLLPAGRYTVSLKASGEETATEVGTATVAAPEEGKTLGSTQEVAVRNYVAMIGSEGYLSLQEAFDAVTTNDATTINLLPYYETDENGQQVAKTIEGAGVILAAGSKNITLNLNGCTYDVTGKLVGSPGTETQGFNLGKGNNVTIQNGTLRSTNNAYMLVQNYSNLTLVDVTLDGSTLRGGAPYTLSNNAGEIHIQGATNIIAAKGGVAFDVCWAPNQGYAEGARVTFDDADSTSGTKAFTGTIDGPVELGIWGSVGTEKPASHLTVKGSGTFKNDIRFSDEKAKSLFTDGTVDVYSGEFPSQVPNEFCASGKMPTTKKTREVTNEDGTKTTVTYYTVKDGTAVASVTPKATESDPEPDTVYYQSFETAFEAVAKEGAYAGQPVDVASETPSSAAIDVPENVTLDLDGTDMRVSSGGITLHTNSTLTNSDTRDGSVTSTVETIVPVTVAENAKNVTIEDVTINGASSTVLKVGSGAVLESDNASYVGSGSATSDDDTGVIDVAGGTIEMTGGSIATRARRATDAVTTSQQNGIYVSSGTGTVTLGKDGSGPRIEAGSNAAAVEVGSGASAKITIDGGYYGCQQGVKIVATPESELTIKNGVFCSTGTEDDSADVYITVSGNTDVTMKELSITGGLFMGAGKNLWIGEHIKNTGFVSGGYFSKSDAAGTDNKYLSTGRTLVTLGASDVKYKNGGVDYEVPSTYFTPRGGLGRIGFVAPQPYLGKLVEPAADAVSVYDAGGTLVEPTNGGGGSHYTLSYDYNYAPGLARVIATGDGVTYTGTAEGQFYISQTSVDDTAYLRPFVRVGTTLHDAQTWLAANPQVYTGQPIQISGLALYAAATATEASDTGVYAVTEDATTTYWRELPHTSEFELSDHATVSTRNYVLDYRDNTAAGTATVAITGAGGFAGVKTLTFKIDEPVAKVTGADGTTKSNHLTLAAAIAAASDGDTITLLTDTNTADGTAGITDANLFSGNILRITNRAVTLDLGGKTLTATSGLGVFNKAVTVRHGNIVFDESENYSNYSFMARNVGGVLTLGDDLTVSFAYSNAYLMAMNGGKIVIGDGAKVVKTAGTPTILADITPNSSAVAGSVEVTGGSIDAGGGKAIDARHGAQVKITGGTIENAGDTSNATVSAIQNLNGATWEVDSPLTKVEITGGVIRNSGTGGAALALSAPATIVVSGGYFSSPLTGNVCADGYVPSPQLPVASAHAGLYTVRRSNAVAHNVRTGAYYGTLAEAVAAAEAGDTIALDADVALDAFVTIDKNLTIDGTKSETEHYKISRSTGNVVLYVNGATDFTLRNTDVSVTHNGNVSMVRIDTDGATVTLDHVKLAAPAAGYGVTAFGKNDTVTITDSDISGYGALYAHSADGVRFEVGGASTLSSTNIYNGTGNTFGTVNILYTTGATITLKDNTKVQAKAQNYTEGGSQSAQYLFNLGYSATKGVKIGMDADVALEMEGDQVYPIASTVGWGGAGTRIGAYLTQNITDCVEISGITAAQAEKLAQASGAVYTENPATPTTDLATKGGLLFTQGADGSYGLAAFAVAGTTVGGATTKYATFAEAADATKAGAAAAGATVELYASVAEQYTLGAGQVLKVQSKPAESNFALDESKLAAIDGYQLVREPATGTGADGVVTYTASTSVAKIGDTPYTTLAAALKAAKAGETVTLLRDAIEHFSAALPGAVALDLGGNKLTVNLAEGVQVTGGSLAITHGEIYSAQDDIIFAKGGTITLGKDLKVVCESSVIYAYDGGTAVIDGADVTSNSTQYVAAFATGAGSSVKMQSGTLTTTAETVTSGGAITAKASAAIEISGGVVTNNMRNWVAVYTEGPSTFTMTGGAVISPNAAAATIAGRGNNTMTGGTMSSGSSFTLGVYGGGNLTVSDKAQVENTGSGNALQTGTLGKSGSYGASDGTLTVTGGTISSANGEAIQQVTEASKTEVSGGLFSNTVPKGYAANGYAPSEYDADKDAYTVITRTDLRAYDAFSKIEEKPTYTGKPIDATGLVVKSGSGEDAKTLVRGEYDLVTKDMKTDKYGIVLAADGTRADYVVAEYAVAAGQDGTRIAAGTTVTVTIEGVNSYSGKFTLKYTIAKAALTADDVAAIADQTYTGAAITPEPAVSYNGTALAKDSDYTLSYEAAEGSVLDATTGKPVDVGSYNAVITIKDGTNYVPATLKKPFVITQAPVAAGMAEGYVTPAYTGDPVTLKINDATTKQLLVKVGDVTTGADANAADYTVSYYNNVNATTAGGAKALATVVGRNNLTGVVNVEFEIGKQVLKDVADLIAKINATYPDAILKAADGALTYNGQAQVGISVDVIDGLRLKFEVTASAGNTSGEAGALAVKGTNADTYTVTIGFDDTNHAWAGDVANMTTTFTIGKATIADADVTIANDGVAYDGGESYAPTVVVTHDGRTLAASTTTASTANHDKDYTVAVSRNDTAATGDYQTYTVTVTGDNNYTTAKQGETENAGVTKTFHVKPAQLTGDNVTLDKTSLEYTAATPALPKASVKLAQGSAVELGDGTATISYRKADGGAVSGTPTDAGSYLMTIAGTGPYTGTVTKEFSITPKSIAGASIDMAESVTYTGREQRPAVTVKDGSTPLERGKDYTLSFTNNVEIGTATVTATGSGNYAGVATKTFLIASVGYGSVLPITQTASEPEGNGTANTTISVSAMTLGWSQADPSIGRTIDACWAGIKIVAPAGVNADYLASATSGDGLTGTVNVSYTYLTGGAVRSFNRNQDGTISGGDYDGHYYMGAWLALTETNVRDAIKAGKTAFEHGYRFDWDGNGTYEQTITVRYDLKGLTLKDKDGNATLKIDASGKLLLDTFALTLADTSQTYAGSALAPTPTLKNGDTELTLGSDYVLQYQKEGASTWETSATDAGTYTVRAVPAADSTTMGVTAGSEPTAEQTFTIGRKSLAAAMVTLDKGSDSFGSATYKTAPTVAKVALGETLLAEADYEVVVPADATTTAGTYTVTVTGDKNYKDSATATYTLAAKPLTDASVAATATPASATYTGSAISVATTLKDGGADIAASADVTYADAAGKPVDADKITAAGSYTATFTARPGSNYSGARTASFEIARANIADATVTTADQPFNGTARDGVTKVELDGYKLKPAEYQVVYAGDHTRVGSVTAVVSGIGNFEGTQAATFKILAPGLADVAAITQTAKVEGSGTTDVTVSLSAMNLTWSPIDTTIERNIAACWAGIDVIAPAAVNASYLAPSANFSTQTGAVTVNYTYLTGTTVKAFNNYHDGVVASGTYAGRHHMTGWFPLTEDNVIAAVRAGKTTLQSGYRFDWDGDGAYDQTVTVSFDVKGLTLHDKDSKVSLAIDEDGTLVYPHQLTKVAAKDPSFDEAGNVEYYVCDDCGKWYEDAEATKEITDKESVVVPKLTAVAQIGEAKYVSLAAAVAAAKDGDTITMVADDAPTAQIVVGKRLTIDFAGHKVQNATNIWNRNTNSWSLISVQGTGADLTLLDSSAGGKGGLYAKANDCYALDLRDGSTLTIKSGTYLGNITAVYVYGCTLNIEGGHFDMTQLATNVSFDKHRYLINCYDDAYTGQIAKVSITGGEFVEWDPSNNRAESTAGGTDFTPEGLTGHTTGDGVWTVVRQTRLSAIAKIDAQTYTGEGITPAVTVTDELGATVAASTGSGEDEVVNYAVAYADNTDAGTATVTVTATPRGAYFGTLTQTFEIKRAQLTGIDAIAQQVYDGDAKEPAPAVRAGEATVPASGYTATYLNNTNVGEAAVIVAGRGGYEGTVVAKFRIVEVETLDALRKQLDKADDILVDVSDETDGMDLKPGTKYTTSQERETYERALGAAAQLASNPNVTAEQVSKAAQALSDATAAYEKAIKKAVAPTIAGGSLVLEEHGVVADGDAWAATEGPVTPYLRVFDENGDEVGQECFDVTITDAAGKKVTDVTEPGTYTVTATGTEPFVGTLKTTLTVAVARVTVGEGSSATTSYYDDIAKVPMYDTKAKGYLAGGTIQLLTDVTIGHDNARFTAGDTTLDLAGHTLTLDGKCLLTRVDAPASSASLTIDDTQGGGRIVQRRALQALQATAGAKLDLKSGTVRQEADKLAVLVSGTGTELTIEGDARVESAASVQAVELGDGATANLVGGSVSAPAGYGVALFNATKDDATTTTLNVSGTSVEAGSFAVSNNGLPTQGATRINVTGGSLVSTGAAALYLPGVLGSTTIGGGEVKGATGVEIRGGSLEVTGGSVTATAVALSGTANAGGSTTEGAGIAVVQHTTKSDIHVAVSGGSVSGAVALYENDTQGNKDSIKGQVTLEVSGGSFKGGKAALDVRDADEPLDSSSAATPDDGTIPGFVTGGSFSSPVPLTYAAPGYVGVPQEGADGLYTVAKSLEGHNLRITPDPIEEQERKGEQIKPDMTVTLGGKPLAEGTDYAVSYGPNVEVGTGRVIITGLGDYDGSTVTRTFAIVGAKLGGIILAGDGIGPTSGEDGAVSYEASYSGVEIAPTVTVTATDPTTGQQVTLDPSDYDVKVLDKDGNEVDPLVNAGDYTVVATATGESYGGSVSAPLSVTPLEIAKVAEISPASADFAGDGRAVGTTVTNKVTGKALAEGSDYTISYTKQGDTEPLPGAPTEPGSYDVSIKAVDGGNYAGETSGSFTVKPVALDTLVLDKSSTQWAEDGVAKPGVRAVSDQNGRTVATTNYAITWYQADLETKVEGDTLTEAGTYWAVATPSATGKGKYTGSAQAKFVVVKDAVTDLAKATVTATLDDDVYDGRAKGLSVEVTMPAGDDSYALSYPDDYDYVIKDADGNEVAPDELTEAGTYTVEVTPAAGSDYTGENTEASVTVKPAALCATRVDPTKEYPYTGSAVLLDASELSVTGAGGAALKEGSDYELVHLNNTKPGLATVTVVGKGNYEGSRVALGYTIVDKSALTTALTKANAAQQEMATGKVLVNTAEEGKRVPSDQTWVTDELSRNLLEARATAEAVLADENARQTDVDAVVAALSAAQAAYEAGKKAGGNAPHVAYTAHVQNIGWQDGNANTYGRKDGALAGTTGRALRVEAIKVRLEAGAGQTGLPYSGSIQYTAHVQNVGWQDGANGFRNAGSVAGTFGRALRVEAFKVRLTDELAKHYDVYYCVHAQNIGWLAWAKNGAISGTTGRSLRLEAIRIELVPKGGKAPARLGTTNATYMH